MPAGQLEERQGAVALTQSPLAKAIAAVAKTKTRGGCLTRTWVTGSLIGIELYREQEGEVQLDDSFEVMGSEGDDDGPNDVDEGNQDD